MNPYTDVLPRSTAFLRLMRSEREQPAQPNVVIATTGSADRRWGRRWLEASGFRVSDVSTTEQLTTLLDQADPKVLVIDGRIWAKENETIRRLSRASIVIVGGPADVIDKAFELGVADIIPKPVDWRLVARRVASISRLYDLSAQLEKTRSLLAKAEVVAEASRHRLDRLEVRDPLTGLANRVGFAKKLERALRALRPGGDSVALLHIDLDRFTTINDAIGRYSGDEVLQRVGERLVQVFRDTSPMNWKDSSSSGVAIARAGSDDFMILVSGVKHRSAIDAVVREIQRRMAEPIEIKNDEIYVTASIGIAMAPDDALTTRKLLQGAETAMRNSQSRGGSTSTFYDASCDLSAQEYEIERQLRTAIANDEFELHYQPLVGSGDSRVRSVEALLRWKSPTQGSVSPAIFVPIAERSGMMVQIGAWVVREACRQLRAWIDAGLTDLRVAVNVSICQLVHADFAEVLSAALAETGVPPGQFEIELSERGALRGESSIIAELETVRSLGVRISVDDFGTGESAIVYLKRFPLDALKIDRSYIRGMMTDENDAAITSAVVAMAHKLRLSVVAEGVESIEQLQRLQDLDCDLIQGFLFSRPVPPDQLQSMLLSNFCLTANPESLLDPSPDAREELEACQ